MKKYWLMAVVVAALLLIQTVLLCGGALAEGEEHEHVYSEEWTTSFENHWHECTHPGCNFATNFKGHTWEGDDESGYKCSVCGFTADHTQHVWSEEWSFNSEDHWHVCTAGIECHYITTPVKHTLVEDGNGGWKCADGCGYAVTHIEHKWSDRLAYDIHDHWTTCSYPGCDATKKDWEEHKMGDYVVIRQATETSDGLEMSYCEKCDYAISRSIPRDGHTHEFSELTWNDYGHYYKCSHEGCNEEKTDAWEEHSLVKDGNGGVKCTICGYARNHEGHVYNDKWDGFDEVHHYRYCTIDGCEYCELKAHTLVNGKCVCGYEKKQEEKPAEPSYDYDNEYVAPAPLPPQTGDASWLAAGIGMIAAAVCIALRKKQSN